MLCLWYGVYLQCCSFWHCDVLQYGIMLGATVWSYWCGDVLLRHGARRAACSVLMLHHNDMALLCK